jgi:hypothetical protein
MGLFSRKKNTPADDVSTGATAPDTGTAGTAAEGAVGATDGSSASPAGATDAPPTTSATDGLPASSTGSTDAPRVTISRAAPTHTSSTDPAAVPTGAGSGAPVPPHRKAAPVVHTALQEALTGWSTTKNVQTMYSVVKELAAGSLLLDIGSSTLADPKAGPQKGDTISIAHQVDNAGKKVLLAFTSGERLGFYRKTSEPVSLVESAPDVVAMAVSKYDGLVLDPGSPETQWIGYNDELVRGLTDDPAENRAVKQAMAEKRIAWPEMLELVRDAPTLYIASVAQRDEAGEITSMGVATVTTHEGDTLSVLLTSPAEVGAWAPGADASPTRFVAVAKVALDQGHAGIVVNPAGSMLTITAAELRALVGDA